MKFLVLGFSFLVFLLACKPKEKVVENKMRFETSNLISYAQPENFDTLLDYASIEKNMIFMEFVAEWCLPCKVMEESTFSDVNVAGFLNENFINYRVDYDSPQGKSLALLFQAEKLPALYFLDGRGRVIIKYSGQLNANDMIQMGEQALELFKNESQTER